MKRLRFLLGSRPLPGRLCGACPTRASLVYSTRQRPQEPPKSGAVPAAHPPLRWNSTDSGKILDKYRSGTPPLDAPLDYVGSPRADVTLHTDGMIDKQPWRPMQRLQRLPLQLRDDPVSLKTLYSALYYLFVLASRAFRLSHRSRDPSADIRSPLQLPPLRCLSPSHIMPAQWRSWRAFCRLGISDNGLAQLSRPQIGFLSSPIHLTKRCTVENGQNSSYGSITSQLTANSFRNPNKELTQAHTLTERSSNASSSPLHSLADSLLREVHATVTKQKFWSVRDMPSSIGRRLSASLPESPLSASVDMADITKHYRLGAGAGSFRQRYLNSSMTASSITNSRTLQSSKRAKQSSTGLIKDSPDETTTKTSERPEGKNGTDGPSPDHHCIENQVYVALGSNIGDRFGAIEHACATIDKSEHMRILETSPLYETEPMYVEDQERFMNGICKVATRLKPMQLLDQLQAIENGLGRVKLIDKGPRNIDLDIVTYENETINTERLIVPHRLMLEREFVLRPLCDTDGKHFRHPLSGQTAAKHLELLPSASTPMYPLTPLSPSMELRSLDLKRRTRVMSILNLTPDSFSDGGVHTTSDIEALKATVTSHIAAGASIIDIGGQSSRPNAPDVTAEEELARIIPAIEAIISLPEASQIAISVDTYRASVASAAVQAGAHIINDISAGLLDPDMLPTIARLGCTYIMMHMRGTPSTMQNEQNTTYPDGVIPTIQRELGERLQAAQHAGIRRWRIILDPGVGFAKTVEQNAYILGNFAQLRNCEALRTYPWLVGSSRKGFIGKITGASKASDRIGGTAATVTAAVQGGTEIVRVHDVHDMVQVVKMADAMYRST